MNQDKDDRSSDFKDVLNIPIITRTLHLPDEQGKQNMNWRSDDLCILYLTAGELSIKMENFSAVVHEGETALVNTTSPTQFCSGNSADFCLLLISPVLFQNSNALPSFIIDLLDPHAAPAIVLSAGSSEHQRATEYINRLLHLECRGVIPYRLNLIGLIHQILAEFLSMLYLDSENRPRELKPESRNLDRMLTYIHTNYQSKIQLSDIAEAGNVSRSRCSPIFRKYLNATPIEYVNNYRLEVSRSCLLDPGISIASVASACGFSGQSYYTKLFVRKYGCTPTEYRSRNR